MVVFAVIGAAQEAAKAPLVINGGVLNGKAVSLPKPAYPVEARQDGASGAVAVDVVIDENGFVISAVSQPYDQSAGKIEDAAAERKEIHPALRTAAETAAMGARFSPTLLSGQPVKIKGTIIYNFAVGGGMTGSGLLNGRAKTLPTPEYPAAALAVRAAGSVSVRVTVDEEGNVISAEAISGHPLLRSAAVSAAREAKFVPVEDKGKPVKVTGVVTYNFTPGGDDKKPSDQ